MKKKLKNISGLSDLYKKYNAFLIDLWGVVHNGIHLFPNTLKVLKKLRKFKKEIIFITNAPRRSKVIISQLSDFGISQSLYNSVVSSGELTWLKIKEKYEKKKEINCFHIGPSRDDHLFKDLNLNITNEVSKSELIINTGPWGDNDILDNYKKILEEGSKNKILMICSNPDKRVIRGNNFMICAGLLAEYYEKIGGKVRYYGKPYFSIYENCLEKLNEKDKSKILIIGDSLDNDIKGANNNSIESLLITSGVHRQVNNNKNIDIEKLNVLMKEKNTYPSFITTKFAW